MVDERARGAIVRQPRQPASGNSRLLSADGTVERRLVGTGGQERPQTEEAVGMHAGGEELRLVQVLQTDRTLTQLTQILCIR